MSSRSGNRSGSSVTFAARWASGSHEHPGRMPGARFFPDARLNFAENLLRRQDDDVAIVFSGEDQVRQTLTAAELPPRGRPLRRRVPAEPASGPATASPPSSPTCRKRSSRCSARPRSAPCGRRARRTSACRACSTGSARSRRACSSSADAYFYGGKTHDSLGKIADVVAALPTVERTVVVPYVAERPDIGRVPKSCSWDEFVGAHDG